MMRADETLRLVEPMTEFEDQVREAGTLIEKATIKAGNVSEGVSRSRKRQRCTHLAIAPIKAR
jgi:NifU-like protein involved in Fe-S cluster formation